MDTDAGSPRDVLDLIPAELKAASCLTPDELQSLVPELQVTYPLMQVLALSCKTDAICTGRGNLQHQTRGPR